MFAFERFKSILNRVRNVCIEVYKQQTFVICNRNIYLI